MDSVERVTKVLRGELPDRVPVGLHSVSISDEIAFSRIANKELT
jgi:hypothetical protein